MSENRDQRPVTAPGRVSMKPNKRQETTSALTAPVREGSNCEADSAEYEYESYYLEGEGISDRGQAT